MTRVIRIVTTLAAVLFLGTSPLLACPFCSAVSQTFTEEIGAMDVVVIADLLKPPLAAKSGNSNEVPKAVFRVNQIVKGEGLVEAAQTIETIYFGDAEKGKSFLIMGVDPPKVMWSTPLLLSARGKEYVPKLLALPAKGAERLSFFQEYLEDDDEMLARDAYDEFAKAPYAAVQSLRDQMKHGQLVNWIRDPDVPASRRRLYLTMLGVCGQPEDIAMLEDMLQSNDRKMKAGLDAMIGCYLTLRGPEGLPLIERLFLEDKKAEYADTYAAIMALRFHGGETDIIPRERILKALQLMLERPQLADLVIPDLARWEDWSVMSQLVKLFKEADDKSSWVRVPVINYLRACPKPEAADYISELEKIDPAAVKRANTFFPFGTSNSPTATATPAES